MWRQAGKQRKKQRGAAAVCALRVPQFLSRISRSVFLLFVLDVGSEKSFLKQPCRRYCCLFSELQPEMVLDFCLNGRCGHPNVVSGYSGKKNRKKGELRVQCSNKTERQILQKSLVVS